MSRKYLFSKFDSHSAIQHQSESLADDINGYDSNAVLTADLNGLLDYFANKYRVDVPELDEGNIEASQQDSKVDVRYDQNRFITDRSRPAYFPGTTFTFHVPYSGERELFDCRPSAFTLNPPEGEVTSTELQLSFQVTSDASAEGVRQQFDGALGRIRTCLNTLRTDFASFNSRLRDEARGKLETRRKKVLADQGTVSSFGFKVRERPDAPKTYTVPAVKRQIVEVPRPKGSAAPLEPALSNAIYEGILDICRNMAIVLEQSPQTFVKLGEEDLRNHFLVQLNGQFEGNATGETFNAAGKTDILIKVDGSNVFIAECKFWDGSKSITDAVNQLLSYSTWRETKIALFVFVRGGDFSSVLRKIDEAISKHTAVVRKVDYPSDTGFRYIVRRPDDPQRDMTLTVLAFAIPAS